MESPVERRLAAIMAADVVGYSAMMERAEEATFSQIGRLRRDVIEPALARHKGRLIKTTGDGIFAEFSSPIAAVNCGIDLQEQLAASAGSIQLRIGINLGDVIVDEHGDIFGSRPHLVRVCGPFYPRPSCSQTSRTASTNELARSDFVF